MTNRIAEITARCEAATPGKPWRTQDRGDYIETTTTTHGQKPYRRLRVEG